MAYHPLVGRRAVFGATRASASRIIPLWDGGLAKCPSGCHWKNDRGRLLVDDWYQALLEPPNGDDMAEAVS